MTKQEYLNQLKAALASYPQDFQAELLEAFEAHFQEGLDAGMREEEVVDTLGSIDEVMETVRMMNQEREEIHTDDPTQAIKNNVNSLARELKDLTRNIGDVVNSALTDTVSKEASFRFSEGGIIDTIGEKVLQTFSSNARIIEVHGNLDVVLSPGDTIQMNFNPYRNVFSKYSSQIEIENEDDRVVFSVGNGGSGQLKLTIPETVEEIHLKLIGGNAKVERINLTDLSIEGASTEMYVRACSGNNLSLSSRSGDIFVADSQFLSIRATSYSGDVDLTSIKGNLVAESVSGDVSVMEHEGDLLTCKSVSGDVDIDESKAITKEASSTSGDIEIKETGVPDSIQAKSISGDVRIYLVNDDVHAILTSLSGDVSFPNNLPYSKEQRNTYIIGDGHANIDASTVSGDITLDI